MIAIDELIFALFVLFIFVFLGFWRKIPVLFLISGLFDLILLGIVADDGTISLNGFNNAGTIVYQTVPAYPFFIYTLALIDVVCFILLIKYLPF